MNILNLATLDENNAGVASRNVNEMFLKAGHNSILLVKESGSNNKNVIAFQRPSPDNFFNKYAGKIKNKLWAIYRLFSPLVKEEKYAFHNLNERKKHFAGSKILNKIPFKPDVILIFWVSDFVNSKTMKELSGLGEAKIFWLMTDNAPLTGGCHYPWNCEGFHTDCSGCPAILTKSKKIIAQKNLAFKNKNLPANLELISGSESDYQRAKKASLFKGKKIHKIIAPIDENKFAPGDKKAAKLHFGISPEKKVIFYGASSLSDPRKGGSYFIEATKMLQKKIESINKDQRPDFLLLLAGREGFEHLKGIGIETKEVGFLNEENLIKAYQAADFVVSPSLEDSGPMMVNQCIMCGTPMVAFNTGVAMDLVNTGETGYKAQLFDAVDFAEGMRYLLMMNEEESKKIASNCRTLALNNFTPDIYARKITSLF